MKNYRTKLAAFGTGLILIPIALVTSKSETSLLILLPAMFFWITIPLLALLAIFASYSERGIFQSVCQHLALLIGGFFFASGSTIGLLALR